VSVRRLLARSLAAFFLVVAGCLLVTTSAAAHPTDEIVEQAYLTPAASGVTVQLDLTPGVLVAPQFARALDTDGDGMLSVAERDAHTATVRAVVTAEVDGTPLDLALAEHRYPPLDLLGAGGGTVTLVWTAHPPSGARQLLVTDRYDPGRTTVQMIVLVPPDPVELGPIRHADGGRTTTVALGPAAAPVAAPATDAPAPGGSSMLDALHRPLTSPWALLVLIGACAALGALHALTPGHGKALLAAYLVGDRAPRRRR
jgi:nickel/cobalt exporter